MNIAIIGYGAMGRHVESSTVQRGHTIAAVFTPRNPLPSAADEYYQRHPIDCCIDFSAADAVRNHVDICTAAGIPLIEGTTGWQRQKTEILAAAQQGHGTLIYGNNFSVGVQLFFRIIRESARLMNSFDEYDAGIHEIHHTRKKDAPSGTAATIAQILTEQLQRKASVKNPLDDSPILPHEINIASSRIGSVIGTHSVLFHSLSDEIELVHRAHHRSGFAAGAVRAAEMTRNVKGVYSFEELLERSIFSHHH